MGLPRGVLGDLWRGRKSWSPQKITPRHSNPRRFRRRVEWTAGTKVFTSGVAYRSVEIDGLDIFYREAGAKDAPAILLLHGFPTPRTCSAT